MAFYLGIYSKQNEVNEPDIQPVLDVFFEGILRPVFSLKKKGFQFYTIEKFKDQIFSGDTETVFLAGWLHHPQAPLKKDPGYYAQLLEHSCQNPGIFFNESEGAFAFVKYNAKDHSLVLAKDKFGVYPLFIYENDHYLVFSSEYEPLTKMPGGKILNADAVSEYFILGSTLGGKTFLKNITNLSEAGLCQVRNAKSQYQSYWIPDIKIDTRDSEVLAKETWELFKSVNQQVFDFHKVHTTLLSAGADSRLILASLTDQQRHSTRFYTSHLSHLSSEEDQDVIGANLLIKKFNLQYIIEKVSFFENEFGGGYFTHGRTVRLHQVYGGWHGGEFMGGFCLNAAPVQGNLKKEEIEAGFRQLFKRSFRRKVQEKIWSSYQRSREQGTLHYVHQFTEVFFTSIYGGSRGYWLQPFQLAYHGYSPFWDSRIIAKLLSVPPGALKNYGFYNQVIKNAPSEFLSVGSNSPLTRREDSYLAPLNTGIEPKFQTPDVHSGAFQKHKEDPQVWKKKMYRKRNLQKHLQSQSDAISKRWLDFEVWYSEYMKW